MAGNYWIKFYIEVLDDPKMAMLDDRTWRRFYELCLIAGKHNKGGLIPYIEQIAWLLRMPADELQDDITQLVELGLVTETKEGYVVTNFSKRQEKMSDADRAQKFRNEKRKDKYYCNEGVTETVTEASRSVTQITDNRLTDNRAEVEADVDVPPSGGDDDVFMTTYYEFQKASGIKAPEDSASWYPALAELNRMGVTANIMRQACQELREKKYHISGPKSIIKACEMILADRSAPIRIPDSAGEYADYIQR